MKTSVKKGIKIAGNVLTYLFLAISVFVVILTITAKQEKDGTSTVLGIQMRIVISESMEKNDATDVSEYEIKDIPLNSMVFIEVMPEDEAEKNAWLKSLKVGDVLTFRYTYSTQETITHRIVGIREKSTGGFIIDLKGDNKTDKTKDTLEQSIDTSFEDSPNYVIGKVTGQSPLLGSIVTMLKQPVGMIFIVIVPCLIIIIIDIIKIVGVANESKKEKMLKDKQKAEEETKRQRDEIEELKRKLAALSSGENAEKKEEK